MKQKSFIKHLRKHNCILDDEDASLYNQNYQEEYYELIGYNYRSGKITA